MLEEFVTCGDCKCVSCLRNHSCPKAVMYDNPCIDCSGVPPYTPWDVDEDKLYNYDCDERKSMINYE